MFVCMCVCVCVLLRGGWGEMASVALCRSLNTFLARQITQRPCSLQTEMCISCGTAVLAAFDFSFDAACLKHGCTQVTLKCDEAPINGLNMVPNVSVGGCTGA